jgi:hypothetical protein
MRRGGSFRLPVLSYASDHVVAFGPSDGIPSRYENGSTGEAMVVRLPARRSVRGVVMEAGSGAPLSGVLVHEVRRGLDVVIGRTDDRGRFAVQFEPFERLGSRSSSGLSFSRPGWIDSGVAGHFEDDLRVEMSRSLRVDGVVRFEDGRPVAGAGVWALGEGANGMRYVPSVTTGADGRFRIRDLAPGDWRLSIHRDDATILPVSTVAASGGSPIEIVVRPSVALAVEVVDEEGSPIDEVQVSAQAESEHGSSDIRKTDARGSATLAALPDAILVVRAELEGFDPVELRAIKPDGKRLRVVLRRRE